MFTCLNECLDGTLACCMHVVMDVKKQYHIFLLNYVNIFMFNNNNNTFMLMKVMYKILPPKVLRDATVKAISYQLVGNKQIKKINPCVQFNRTFGVKKTPSHKLRIL